MSTNWLETAGSWLAKPFRAAAGPWWEKLVEAKAEDRAVRRMVLEAVVRIRLSDFAKSSPRDPDQLTGLAIKIVDHLKAQLNNEHANSLESDAFLRRVESEIHFHGTRELAWVQLACLYDVGTFGHGKFITVHCADNEGSESHGGCVVTSLQSDFPFFRMFIPATSNLLRLSPEAVKALRDYCSRTSLPDVKYDLHDYMGVSPDRVALADQRTLPAGWKPSGEEQPVKQTGVT